MTNRKVSAAAEGVSVTLSQRVNALLASYVAIEAEQMPLATSGDANDDNRAADLGKNAIAIRDEIRAIRDRSANPDLLAARILLDFMLDHQWTPEAGINWGPEEEADALPMLEILSGGLTGAVRHEARRALATIGIEIPETDPFVARMETYRGEVVAFDAALDNGVDPGDPSDRFAAELTSGALAIGSTAGVAEVLRHVLTNESIGDTFDIQLVEAGCAFLEGRA